jgi:hypothetical protein
MHIDENDPVEGVVDRIGFVSDRRLPHSAHERLVALVVLEGSSTVHRIRETLMDDFAAVALTRRGDRVDLFADGEDVRSFTNRETGSTASLAEFTYE